MSYEKAHNILETYRDALERVAQALLDREVLDATELKLLIEGQPLPQKPSPPAPPAPPLPSKEPLTLRPDPRPIPGLAKREKPAPA
jgi:cell division protease FtsH